jgi:Kef-type K+ transport system membrane component KefB/nucleotide-binding universal stress UspA family protein
MFTTLQEPVAVFLAIMAVVLISPILSERVRLPGIVGIILGGMFIGPYGLNLLAAQGQIEFLATIGLVYLMFSAGMEVDLAQFNRVRKRSMVFGLLTFLIPLGMGAGLGLWLGMGWLGAILLGSAFSSHTLIAFPILTRLGVTRNEAVAVTVGATVMTDIGAFIVLALVLGAKQGNLEAGYFLRLLVFLAIFAGLVLFGIPRLGKVFFRRFSGRAVEFQFVLVVLLLCALVAEKIGVHEVVGAFLAGLAINATLPRHSPVIGHVLFMGESFFIPVFLLFSGMITNPLALFSDPRTLLIGLAVTAVAYISKFLAAWLTGRIFHYSRAELGIAYGLSHAQAAVTIPTLVIGLENGLFDSSLFNAAILMILFTSITSPMMVQRYARRLDNGHAEEEEMPLFGRVLVPLANPQTQENLLSLASLLARAQGGRLLALNVALEGASQTAGLAHQRELLGRVPEMIGDPETQVQLLPRIAQSYARGIVHTALEQQASLIVMGWRGKPSLRESLLGSVLDEVVWESHVPVLVARVPVAINAIRHVTLVLPNHSLPPDAVRRSLAVVVAISRMLNAPLSVLASSDSLEKVKELLKAEDVEQHAELRLLHGPVLRQVLADNGPQHTTILPTLGSRKRFQSSLGDLPEQLAAASRGNVIVLHFPH